MAVEIVILTGSRQGERLGFEKSEFRIGGLPDCDVYFDPQADEGAKDRAATFRLQDDGWYVRRTGGGIIYVNRESVPGSSRLRSGDIVRMSDRGPDFSFSIVRQLSAAAVRPGAVPPAAALPAAASAPAPLPNAAPGIGHPPVSVISAYNSAAPRVVPGPPNALLPGARLTSVSDTVPEAMPRAVPLVVPLAMPLIPGTAREPSRTVAVDSPGPVPEDYSAAALGPADGRSSFVIWAIAGVAIALGIALGVALFMFRDREDAKTSPPIAGPSGGTPPITPPPVEPPVTPPPVDPPKLEPLAQQTAEAGKEWNFQVPLVGPKPPAGSVVFRLGGSVPSGMLIDARTGVIRWTPSQLDVGQPRSVTVEAALVANARLSDRQPLTISVQDSSKPDWPSIAGPLKEAIFFLQAELKVGDNAASWPLSTCCAVRDDTLLTSGTAAIDVAVMQKKGFKVATQPAKDFRAEVKEVRLHAAYAKLYGDLKERRFFDLALLTVEPRVSKTIRLSSAQDVANLEEGLRVACLGYTYPQIKKLTRHDRLTPEIWGGEIFLVKSPSQQSSLGPRSLDLTMALPPHAYGSPVINTQGTLVGVYTEAATGSDAKAIQNLQFATVANPEWIAAWLNDRDSKQWVVPRITESPAPASPPASPSPSKSPAKHR